MTLSSPLGSIAPEFPLENTGTRSANVDPSPGILSTVTSPPIKRASFPVIASPSPVPPYRRVVDASAWEKAWNRSPTCSAVIPMPVSLTRKTTKSPSSPCSRVRTSRIAPFVVNRLSRTWCLRLTGQKTTSLGREPDSRAAVGAQTRDAGGSTSEPRSHTASLRQESRPFSSAPLPPFDPSQGSPKKARQPQRGTGTLGIVRLVLVRPFNSPGIELPCALLLVSLLPVGHRQEEQVMRTVTEESIDWRRTRRAVFQSRTRYAATPRVFRNAAAFGSRSTAFRARASPRAGSNQGSLGFLTSDHARLLLACRLSGSSVKASR